MNINELKWANTNSANNARNKLEIEHGLSCLEDILDYRPYELNSHVSDKDYIWTELCTALDLSSAILKENNVILTNEWKAFINRMRSEQEPNPVFKNDMRTFIITTEDSDIDNYTINSHTDIESASRDLIVKLLEKIECTQRPANIYSDCIEPFCKNYKAITPRPCDDRTTAHRYAHIITENRLNALLISHLEANNYIHITEKPATMNSNMNHVIYDILPSHLHRITFASTLSNEEAAELNASHKICIKMVATFDHEKEFIINSDSYRELLDSYTCPELDIAKNEFMEKLRNCENLKKILNDFDYAVTDITDANKQEELVSWSD